jgi:uncharacterized Zn finger protein (UPF0148 family)
MSDFDKEAERRRLREKYEAEAEDREATQHMSELLLKGATMTNSHCGTCGDPIFRYDGQEFCPSCNADGGQAVENPDDAEDVAAAADATDVNVDATGHDATGAETDATAGSAPGAAGTSSAGMAGAAGSAGSDRDAGAAGASQPASSTGTREPTPAPSTTREDDATPRRPVDGDDAVANVEATLQRFAALAADTDDPGRAQECLAVVKEAAETLDALGTGGR